MVHTDTDRDGRGSFSVLGRTTLSRVTVHATLGATHGATRGPKGQWDRLSTRGSGTPVVVLCVDSRDGQDPRVSPALTNCTHSNRPPTSPVGLFDTKTVDTGCAVRVSTLGSERHLRGHTPSFQKRRSAQLKNLRFRSKTTSQVRGQNYSSGPDYRSPAVSPSLFSLRLPSYYSRPLPWSGPFCVDGKYRGYTAGRTGVGPGEWVRAVVAVCGARSGVPTLRDDRRVEDRAQERRFTHFRSRVNGSSEGPEQKTRLRVPRSEGGSV